jgi:hypothetical protein
MPNYVTNKLTVRGENAALLRSENEGGEYPLDFRVVVPHPDDWNAVQKGEESYWEKYGKPTIESVYGEHFWLPWRRNHWGTKSNPRDTEVFVDEKKGEVVYTFDTAWSAPDKWLATAAERYPDLSFSLEYGEEGNHYSGCIRFKVGIKISHEGGPFTRFFNADEEEEEEEDHEDKFAKMEEILHNAAYLGPWLQTRDPFTYWILSMRGSVGDPMMGEPPFDSRKSVTVDELREKKIVEETLTKYH